MLLVPFYELYKMKNSVMKWSVKAPTQASKSTPIISKTSHMPVWPKLKSLSVGKMAALYSCAFITALYMLEWILRTWQDQNADSIAISIRPFQNHYFSLSHYYLTNEGTTWVLTDNMRATGRFITLLIPGGFGLLLVMAPVYFLKVFSKHLRKVFVLLTILTIALLINFSFFNPSLKATFLEDVLILEETKWIFLKDTKHIGFNSIEKFDFRFYHSSSGYNLYAQIFVVSEGREYLIGENQITPVDDSYQPSIGQETEIKATISTLTRLIHR